MKQPGTVARRTGWKATAAGKKAWKAMKPNVRRAAFWGTTGYMLGRSARPKERKDEYEGAEPLRVTGSNMADHECPNCLYRNDVGGSCPRCGTGMERLAGGYGAQEFEGIKGSKKDKIGRLLEAGKTAAEIIEQIGEEEGVGDKEDQEEKCGEKEGRKRVKKVVMDPFTKVQVMKYKNRELSGLKQSAALKTSINVQKGMLHAMNDASKIRNIVGRPERVVQEMMRKDVAQPTMAYGNSQNDRRVTIRTLDDGNLLIEYTYTEKDLEGHDKYVSHTYTAMNMNEAMVRTRDLLGKSIKAIRFPIEKQEEGERS